jgi:hypothetical protein
MKTAVSFACHPTLGLICCLVLVRHVMCWNYAKGQVCSHLPCRAVLTPTSTLVTACVDQHALSGTLPCVLYVQAAVSGQQPTDPVSNAVLPSLDLVPVWPMRSRAAEYRDSTIRAGVQAAIAPDCTDPVRYLRR